MSKIYRYILLTALMTAFIFSNSMTEGAASTSQSGKFVRLAQIVLDKTQFLFGGAVYDFLSGNLSFIIRKAAHFFSFFVLYLFCFPLFWFYKKIWRYAVPLIYCSVCALVDESIQFYIEGRSGNIKDVVLDIFGSLAALTIIFLYNNLKKQKRALFL